MLPALLLARAHGWRKAIAAGLLLSVRLSLIVAASDIATRIGVFDAATNAAMVLVAIISAVVAPLLFNVLIEEQPEGDTTRDQPASDNRSVEHTSELQSLMRISYAVFCLKKKNTK